MYSMQSLSLFPANRLNCAVFSLELIAQLFPHFHLSTEETFSVVTHCCMCVSKAVLRGGQGRAPVRAVPPCGPVMKLVAR